MLDARSFPAEKAKHSLAREIVRLYQGGLSTSSSWRTRAGIGSSLMAWDLAAPACAIDVYGSSGDYLASGIDGAEVFVHGDAQDQLAQIMKDGKLVVYGSVGQTFLYAGKGGQAFVLGNAAGRPLINAVGKPRVVINGTCLDYLAESFMAGDPLDGRRLRDPQRDQPSIAQGADRRVGYPLPWRQPVLAGRGRSPLPPRSTLQSFRRTTQRRGVRLARRT